MTRARFAPSPTGSLHLGNALSAAAARSLADWLLLRIDDTDPERNLPGGEQAIVADLEWLGIEWDAGPVRQSERADRYAEVRTRIGDVFDGVRIFRADGSATYHVASVVDDVDFAITHVVRGNDHRPNERLHRRLFAALGAEPPVFVHHGLILGPDGKKLAKRAYGGSVLSLRERGIPAEAVRAYLDELGLPRHDVRLDLARIGRLSVEAIARMGDEELAARAGVPVSAAPVMRGARNLVEAREYALQVLEPAHAQVDSPETLTRFRELVAGGVEPRSIVRELKAVGGDLRAVRLALTGRERGPELAAVIESLPREELLRRAALG